MLNKVILMGRLVADPEFRSTESGTAVTTFRMAVDRDFKNKQTGEKEADFITCVAWRNTAEFVSRYFTKGSMAAVEGRLQVRNYTDNDGNKRYVTEVVANSVYFAGSKANGDNAQTGGAAPYNGGTYNADVSFSEIDSYDGDLPF